MSLWNNDNEIEFFRASLQNFATPEQIFYFLQNEYYAYVPKGYSAEGQTINSRNSLIGKFTETWCKSIFDSVANSLDLYAVNGVICDELGLTRSSPADMAFCSTNAIQQEPSNIKLLFEIKMSIISNYKFTAPHSVVWIGDYHQHNGNPSLLRSDSMLKAIGKAINVRVSCQESTKIPIVVLGNSPITNHYTHKVDFLKASGVLQGFWSLYPMPTTTTFIKETHGRGFITINNTNELLPLCKNLVDTDMSYFSSMMPKDRIGEIIRIANQEVTDIGKAEKFLQLIRG